MTAKRDFVNLYEVVLELAELREVETAHHLLRETAPMSSLKQANPERQESGVPGSPGT